MMQQQNNKTSQFLNTVGDIFKRIRTEKTHNSINQFAREYDIDRGNLSKIERGLNSCRLITAWKLCEAAGIKFSEFAKILENELGNDFSLTDE